MNKDAFETAVLELWIQSAIPLTMANLQYHTGLPRRRVRAHVDALVLDGVLEMDSDASGELVFSVPGAHRNARGPKSFAELERLDALSRDVAGKGKRRGGKKQRGGSQASTALERVRDAQTAMTVAQGARRELSRDPGERDKSLLISAGLSFFFGPFGWFYAGSLREAIMGAAGFMALGAILPQFLLLPLLTVLLPISGVAGLVYAWQHNRNGHRGPILGKDE